MSSIDSRPPPPKWMYILPNFFTISSILCGLFAITTAARAHSTHDYFIASIAIFVGMILDGFDGRVARLTNTQSEFGVQLDSLADVISFGVTPAIVLYYWALESLGFKGFLIAGIYASCGAIRLARFNVMANKSTGPNDYFTGLPIPLAAGMVIALVIAVTRAPELIEIPSSAIALLTLVLSFLMVSTIPYYSFKKVSFTPPFLIGFALFILSGILISIFFRPSLMWIVFFSAYIFVGLIIDMIQRAKGLQKTAHVK